MYLNNPLTADLVRQQVTPIVILNIGQHILLYRLKGILTRVRNNDDVLLLLKTADLVLLVEKLIE